MRASVLCKYEVADVWVTNHQVGTVEVWGGKGRGGGARARLYGENVNPEQ